MSKLAIKFILLSSLIPYVKNARTHTPAQIEKIKRSLVENDWTNPMLVAGTDLLAGHARLAAAIALRNEGAWTPRHGNAATGPVIDLSHLSPAQRRAYIIADNKLAIEAGWDDDLLKIELADLKALDFDLILTGFSNAEIDKLLKDAGPFPDLSGESKMNDELRYQVVIDCDSEEQQAQLFERLREEGHTCRLLML